MTKVPDYTPSDLEHQVITTLASTQGKATIEDLIWSLRGNEVSPSDAMTGADSATEAKETRAAIQRAILNLHAVDCIELPNGDPFVNPAGTVASLTIKGWRLLNSFLS